MKHFAIPVALVLVGAVYLLLTRDTDQPKLPTPVQTTPAKEVTEVVYSKGTRLFVFDLESGDSRPAGRVPTTDFQISPDGELWAATNGVPQKRDPDPRIEPTEIILGEVEGEVIRSLGIGYSPVWSPDGEDVAAVSPAEGYFNCPVDVDPEKAKEDPSGQGCSEGERVLYYDIDVRNPRIALGAAAWEILGWTGGRQIIGYSLKTNNVVIGFAGATFEQQTEIPIAREDILAISPTEQLLLISEDGTSALADAEGNRVTQIDLAVRSAIWSPSGEVIAVIAQDGVVLVTVDDGEQTIVGESMGAGGPVIWSGNGSTFAFLTGPREEKSLMVCPSTGSDCESHGFPRSGTLRALR